MAEVGKWGITRDSAGALASLWEWPWYWRYAGGAAIAAVSAIAAYVLAREGVRDWQWMAVGGLGILIALSVMYELGCLAIGLAALGAIWVLTDAYLPDFDIGPHGMAVLAAIGAYYAWSVAYEARRKAEENSRRIDGLSRQLQELDSDRKEADSDLYTRLYGLGDRIKKLEGDDLNVQWEAP